MITKRIKELREDKGLTIKALAEELGLNVATLSTYERGTREPSINTIVQLAKYFNVTSDYLLGVSDNKIQENAVIGKELGLSDMSIAKLTEINSEKEQNYIKALNMLIEHEKILHSISNYFYSETSSKSFYLMEKDCLNYVSEGKVYKTKGSKSKGDLTHEQYSDPVMVDNVYLMGIQQTLRNIKENYNKEV